MSEFHLLRPWWLLALVPMALLAWRIWNAADRARDWRDVIAPHLLPHLLIGNKHGSRRWPTIVLIAGWTMGILSLAGPTWRREPAPFVDDQAVLVIVLKVTTSMQAADLQPTRLARSVQKIHDLLELRPGAQTALVAYSGTAHQVMPLTTDAGIINSFAEELDPSVMPTEGDAAGEAIRLADQIVCESQQRGWILWISDSASPELTQELAEYRQQNRTPVTVLAAASKGTEQESLSRASTSLHAEFLPITPDDEDVQQLAKNTRFSAATVGGDQRWQDAGYWVVPILACGCLLCFRRGWVVEGASA